MADDILGMFETEVLDALVRRPHEAYGISIQAEIAAQGRKPSLGALYTTLDRLEAKGMVTSRWGEPTTQRGGRRKRYYTVTGKGQFALNRTHEAFFRRGWVMSPRPVGA